MRYDEYRNAIKKVVSPSRKGFNRSTFHLILSFSSLLSSFSHPYFQHAATGTSMTVDAIHSTLGQSCSAYPSLEQLTEILYSSTSSPSTLRPPSDPIYPSTSQTAPSTSSNQYARPSSNLVPVYIEIPADLLTPVAAYLKVANDSDHSFLLESVVGGENLARYSFVGAGMLCIPIELTDRSFQDGSHWRGL